MTDDDLSRYSNAELLTLLVTEIRGVTCAVSTLVGAVTDAVRESNRDECDEDDGNDDPVLGSGMPSGPGEAGVMPYWRYRLYWEDGSEAGEAQYVERIKPGEIVWVAGGTKLRVLDVIDEHLDNGYLGLLRVEAA